MISVDTFFSGTLNTVDAVIGNYVHVAYVHFLQANTGLITLLFTVYVIFIGYRFLMHAQPYNLMTLARHVIIMLSVYGLLINWHLYNLFVYRVFTTEPGNIAKILVESAGRFASGGTISQALDDFYSAIIQASTGFLGQVNFSVSGIAFVFYAALVFLIGSLLCIFALLLFVYAKMMMAVALALGPIFILFILWDPTKNIFTAWINQLITIALIPVVTSAILVLMLSVIHVTLGNIQQPISVIQFSGIAPFLGLSLATTLILTQVFRISSSLGGGITLVSISAAGAIASSAIEKSGMAILSRNALYWSKNKIMRSWNNGSKKV